MKKILKILFVVALFSAQIACSTLPKSAQEKTLEISTVSGKVAFDVEVARTGEELKTGLMYRDFLAEKNGMIFYFSKPAKISMWMKNTLIPLDMIFFDETKKVVDIFSAVPPCKTEPCPSYVSSQKALYVLELNGGDALRYGINLGDSFEFME